MTASERAMQVAREIADEIADRAVGERHNQGMFQFVAEFATEAIATALDQFQVPEGWVLVPKVPIREQVAAAFEARDHVSNALSRASEGGFSSGVIAVYSAMLAAAPKPEGKTR